MAKAEEETPKRKRGRPSNADKAARSAKSQAKTGADDEQEPITNFRKDADTNESDTEDSELVDPSLFTELDQERIPKLEKRGRAWLKQDDFAKKETEKAKELAEECQLIMADHGISKYDHGDLHLVINQTLKLKGSLG